MAQPDADFDPAVAEAVRPIQDLDQLETSDHVGAFGQTHENFQRLLASPEDDTTSS